MSSFMDAMSQMDTKPTSGMKEQGSMDFVYRYPALVAGIVEQYKRGDTDLNKMIAQTAKINNFNEEQIKRVVERVNTSVYLHEFNKKKAQSVADRSVGFPVALLDKVRALMQDTRLYEREDSDTDMKTAYVTEDGEMEKSASVERMDPLNAFNYKSHSFGPAGSDVYKTERDVLLEKVASKVVELHEEVAELSNTVHSEADMMATAIIKLASLGKDPQEVFAKSCQRAGMSKIGQEIVAHAYAMKTKDWKESHKLPGYFPDEVVPVEITAEEDFSLGDKSLMKEAEMDIVNKDEIPTVVLDNKRIIKKYQNLSDMLMDIDKYQEKLIEKQEKINKVDKMQKAASDKT